MKKVKLQQTASIIIALALSLLLAGCDTTETTQEGAYFEKVN